MSNILLPCASLAALIVCATASPAYADSADAICEALKNGRPIKEQSGSCTFSQRQGYIDLSLRNGEEYSLSPGSKASHFTDQRGEQVVRKQAGGSTHTYEWEGGRTIMVRFGEEDADDGGGAMAGAFSEPTTTTERVRFDAGSSGAELSGSLTPGSSIRYVLNARNGQDFYVRVAPQGPDIYYQIFNPDGTFLLDQMTSSKEYRGQLWQTGDHVVEVINRGSRTTSYNVIFGL